MENASKALIMAGEILISVIIVSALMLMFNNLTNYQNINAQNDREAEVLKFNNQFEAYNRKDIRGNDLYTLLNHVVDYNRRKTTKGTGEKDEGDTINYQPITIEISFVDENTRNLLSDPEGKNNLFKRNGYTIDANSNTFDDLFDDIRKIEGNYPAGALRNLSMGITKIFISDDSFENLSKPEKKEIIQNFNKAYGSEKLVVTDLDVAWKNINEVSECRKEVYLYYEYLQFTRAHFDCVKTDYNEGTGRIVYMKFNFNGNIN